VFAVYAEQPLIVKLAFTPSRAAASGHPGLQPDRTAKGRAWNNLLAGLPKRRWRLLPGIAGHIARWLPPALREGCFPEAALHAAR